MNMHRKGLGKGEKLSTGCFSSDKVNVAALIRNKKKVFIEATELKINLVFC